MTWQAYSIVSVTGAILDRVPASDLSWARALSAGADGSITVPRDEIKVSDAAFDDLFAHWKRTIVLEHDGVVRFAGLINAEPEISGRSVTFGLTDLWGLWSRRGAWDHNAPSIAGWTQTYSGLSLRTLAKRAVQRGTTGPSAPPIALPITLEADVSGSHERSYFGYHMETVADVLDDLALEGVKIDFAGRWLSGAFDWEMRTDPTPTIHEWHVTAALGGGVSKFSRNADGAKMTNNSIFVGEGAEVEMLVRNQADESSDLPLLERIDARKYVTDVNQLQNLANEGAVVYGPPTDAWSFEVMIDGDPKISAVKLGDTARLWFSGHWRIPDGMYDRRITKIEGSLGNKATITVQPTVASGGVDHTDARQELERLQRRVKALETATPMNHTSISYYEPGAGLPINYYDGPGGDFLGGGSGIVGIGIDTVEAISRSDYDALGTPNPTTLYAIDESS